MSIVVTTLALTRKQFAFLIVVVNAAFAIAEAAAILYFGDMSTTGAAIVALLQGFANLLVAFLTTQENSAPTGTTVQAPTRLQRFLRARIVVTRNYGRRGR